VFEHLRDTTFEKDGVKVRVVGFPYSMTRSLEELRSVRKGEEDYLVAVVHALAGESPPDSVQEFFNEPVFRYKDLVSEDGPDVWCFGHWHTDQGIVEVDGKTFVNQGSVCRGALVKENLTRIPKVALLEFTDKVEASPIPLEVAPASEVFDLARKERQDKETQSIEQFVDRMQENLEAGEDVDVEGAIQKLEFSKDIGRLAMEYLERART